MLPTCTSAFYDHIMDMMEELPQAPFEHKIEVAVSKKGLDIRHDRLSKLVRVIPKVMTFFDRDPNDAALNRPNTVEYIDRVVSGYKNNKLPQGMIDVIDYTYAYIESEEQKRLAKNTMNGMTFLLMSGMPLSYFQKSIRQLNVQSSGLYNQS